jgi:hypothetical protein
MHVQQAGIPAVAQKPPNNLLAMNRPKEFFSVKRLLDGAGIVIFHTRLRFRPFAIAMKPMTRWRTTMRELSAGARLHRHARTVSGRSMVGIQTFALYASFALIAAIVVGSVTVHPF